VDRLGDNGLISDLGFGEVDGCLHRLFSGGQHQGEWMNESKFLHWTPGVKL